MFPLALGARSRFARLVARMSTVATHEVQRPRMSASLVLINGQCEVLMVERKPNASSFAGMHVFPGGNVDKQDATLEVTAIRETFEETGLLFCNRVSPLSRDALELARSDIHASRTTFAEFCAQHTLSPRTSDLLRLSQWITPPTAPRRFHAHFFAAFLDAAPDVLLHTIAPRGDGGAEVVRAHWVAPSDALAAQHAGTAFLMPPQYYILRLLANIFQRSIRTVQQENILRAISSGPFGSRVFNPRAAKDRLPDGRSILTYEGDELRDGDRGAKHRSLVRFGAGGTVTQIELERNIDVFGVAIPESSKL